MGDVVVGEEGIICIVGGQGRAVRPTEFSDASVEMALNVHKSTPSRGKPSTRLTPFTRGSIYYSLFCFFFHFNSHPTPHPSLHTPQPQPRSVSLSGGRNCPSPINRLRANVSESAMFEQHSTRLILRPFVWSPHAEGWLFTGMLVVVGVAGG